MHSQHGFFGWFNRWFDSATLRYQSGVSYVIRRAGRFMLIYLVLIGGLVFMFKTLPRASCPTKTRVCCSPRSSCYRRDAGRNHQGAGAADVPSSPAHLSDYPGIHVRFTAGTFPGIPTGADLAAALIAGAAGFAALYVMSMKEQRT